MILVKTYFFYRKVSAIASQEFGQITPEFGFQWQLYDICVKIMGNGFRLWMLFWLTFRATTMILKWESKSLKINK